MGEIGDRFRQQSKSVSIFNANFTGYVSRNSDRFRETRKSELLAFSGIMAIGHILDSPSLF